MLFGKCISSVKCKMTKISIFGQLVINGTICALRLDGAHPASEAFIELVLIAYCEDPREITENLHNGDRIGSYR